MNSFIRQSFETIISDAKQSESWYVCLMEAAPYYGGPEEGGWSGEDRIVVAYKEFPSQELAEKAKESVEKLAKELTEESRIEFGNHCLNSMKWLENRGLDADFLPEPDGESNYYVYLTQELPQNSYGSRHFE